MGCWLCWCLLINPCSSLLGEKLFLNLVSSSWAIDRGELYFFCVHLSQSDRLTWLVLNFSFLIFLIKLESSHWKSFGLLIAPYLIHIALTGKNSSLANLSIYLYTCEVISWVSILGIPKELVNYLVSCPKP